MQPKETCKGRPPDGWPDPRQARQSDQRLALIGLSPALMEPVSMLAEIMGWDVVRLPGGPVVRPQVRLCLAVLPGTADDPSPLAVWSPDSNLNELISRLGLSRLDHPPCLLRLELLLQIGTIQSPGSGQGRDDACQSEHPRGSDEDQTSFGHSAADPGQSADFNCAASTSSDTGFDRCGSGGQSAPERDAWQ